jgi:hypothetical protein
MGAFFNQERIGAMTTTMRAAGWLGMGLLIGGIGLVGIGLSAMTILPQLWSPDGWLRFKHFAALVGAIVTALPFVFWRREALGSLVAGTAALVALLGIGPAIQTESANSDT